MTEDNSELICVATRREFFDAAVTAHLTRISIETGVESAIRDNENYYFRDLRRVPGGRYITYTGWIEDVDMRRIIILDLNSSDIVWAFLENSNGNLSGEVTSDGGSIIYLSQYRFDWTSEDGESYVGSSSATKICRQPIDIEVRFAVGNAPLPSELPDDYGLLAQFGTRLSDIDVASGLGNSPIWSPDGKKIAFVADGGKIWETPADGGEMVQVYDNPDIVYQGYSLTIPRTDLYGYSADGNEILFSKETVDEARGSLPVLTVKGDELSGWSWSNAISYLYALNLNTGEVRTVVECGDYGVYSPDGRYLAYTVRDANLTDTFVQEHKDQIIIRNLESGMETFLPLSTHQNFKWTNDSSAIWAHTSPTEYQLVPIDGSAPDTLQTTISWLYTINSNYPLIVAQEGNGLYSINYKTGDRNKLTPELECDFMNPAFSPDGSKLAYLIKYEGKSRNNPYSTGYRTHLFIMDYPVPTDIIPTVVEDAVPAAELLIANYPNPFNPSTTITFSLPSEGVAHLDIYNLSGQKVRELVSDNLSAGMHEVVWDSRSESGMPLASGMYIARITAGSHVATQRMLLMK